MGEKGQQGHSKGRKPPMSKSHKGYGGGGKSGYRNRKGGQPGRNTRSGRGRRRNGDSRPELQLTAGAQLPKWVLEEVNRTTRKERRQAALQHLEAAAAAFAEARYGKAIERAEQAKKATSANATIREILGLSLYRSGRWEQALKELRTFRRISGETTHLPVEMDCLRALDRPHGVEKAWHELHQLGGRPDTMREGKVVYGSFLLDSGRAQDAWKVVNPRKIGEQPPESALRQWYVAARVAAHLGDAASARQLIDAISAADPAFPGLDELEAGVGI